MRNDIVIRLTAWYAAVFTLSSLLVGGLVYGVLVSNFRARMDEALRNEAGEMAGILTSKGINALQDDIDREAVSEGIDTMFVRVVTRDGRELAVTDLSAWQHSGLENLSLDAGDGMPILTTIVDSETGRRARTLVVGVGNGRVLQMGDSLEDDDRVLQELRGLFAVAMVAVIMIAGFGGWFMAKRALSGVEAVTRTARAISMGDMTRRVPVTGWGDEIDRLAATFNEMLDRIQQLVQGMREVNDNIAHDLRSPITRMRAAAELAIETDGSSGSVHHLGAGIIEECDRLLAMIDTMLDISEAESGVARFSMQPVDMKKVVQEGCDLFSAVMEDKNIELKIDMPQEPAIVKGDVRWLQRTLSNLLDNASKYTPPGGRVGVRVKDDGLRVSVTVEDTGTGIAPADLPRIFERFYRADSSRSRPGSGLGLSLAQAVARAHGGDLQVSSEPDAGSRFTIVVPRSFDNV